jgi:hypothetical protein
MGCGDKERAGHLAPGNVPHPRPPAHCSGKCQWLSVRTTQHGLRFHGLVGNSSGIGSFRRRQCQANYILFLGSKGAGGDAVSFPEASPP